MLLPAFVFKDVPGTDLLFILSLGVPRPTFFTRIFLIFTSLLTLIYKILKKINPGVDLNICGFVITILICNALSLYSTPASASEIDSFTRRSEFLPDLTELLNQQVMDRLEKAVKRSNRQSRYLYLKNNYPFRGIEGEDYCNPDHLYGKVGKQFARTLIGQLESYINHLPDTKRRMLNFDESIYGKFLFREAPTLAGTKRMGSLIRIGDYTIGADKFGHFFSEGWSYFVLAYGEKIDIETALLFGEVTESAYYGAMTTGIFSYADLIANFNGMRFWNALIGFHFDALNPDQMPLPYVCCKNRRWKIAKKFNWLDYIDGAWDEGINYSLFRDATLLNKVRLQISEMDKKNSEDNCCPEKHELMIDTLSQKYRVFEDRLLNLDGHDILYPKLQPRILLNRYYFRKRGRPMSDWEKRMLDRFEKSMQEWREDE